MHALYDCQNRSNPVIRCARADVLLGLQELAAAKTAMSQATQQLAAKEKVRAGVQNPFVVPLFNQEQHGSKRPTSSTVCRSLRESATVPPPPLNRLLSSCLQERRWGDDLCSPGVAEHTPVESGNEA